MNTIDWESLKKAVAENDKNSTDDLVIEILNADTPSNEYATRKLLRTYLRYFQSTGYKSDDIRKLYVSLFGALEPYENKWEKAIAEDIKELDICISSGAYKAALILSGSILEAFLLDWLSEKDGKNYFDEHQTVMVQATKRDGTRYWKETHDLYDYIEKIAVIEHPDWMESKQKAHYIRNKRNDVHAKLCLRDEEGINLDTCNKVISYLKEIIDTRVKKRDSEFKPINVDIIIDNK